MLVFAIIAVFVAGLMVGRTPEYLGKKIEAYEMKMASLVILIPCALVARRHRDRRDRAGRARPASPIPARTASARSSTRSRRRRTTTAARSPALGANTPFYNTPLGICDVLRALSGSDRADARDRRLAGAEEARADSGRHAADAHAAVRRAARRHGRRRRRADVHPGARARPDRRAPVSCIGQS